MSRRTFKGLALALLLIPVAVVFAFLGVGMLARGSAGGMLSTGRSVINYSDSMTLSSSLSKDTATIRTSGKAIVVKPTALHVDSKNVATIDEAVLDVEVRVNRGEITFVADGNVVLAMPK